MASHSDRARLAALALVVSRGRVPVAPDPTKQELAEVVELDDKVGSPAA